MGLVALMHVDLPRVSEVTQSCPTPCDPMDTRLLRPWDFLGKNTRGGCDFLLQEVFPTQGLNPRLPHCRQMLYHLSHQGSTWWYYCGSGDPSIALSTKGLVKPPQPHAREKVVTRGANPSLERPLPTPSQVSEEAQGLWEDPQLVTSVSPQRSL